MSEETRAAKAEAKAAKARAKSLRPWFLKKRFWLLAAVALIIVGGIATGSSSSKKSDSTSAANAPSVTSPSGVVSDSNNKDHPPAADVTITKCSIDDLGLGNATLAITNHSTGESDYITTVAFDNAAGTQIGTGTSLVDNVDPSQTANDTASGGLTGSTAGMRCVLKQVDRTASAG